MGDNTQELAFWRKLGKISLIQMPAVISYV